VFFTALAERAAAFEWRGPEDFAALLHELYSGPEAPGVNPVQVMTIHRAKGLQFDHVFCAGTGPERRRRRATAAALDRPATRA